MTEIEAQTPDTGGVNPWLIAAAVMLPTFMEVLDTAIASVALPYIAGSLSATTDEATWVLTSYLVANAVFLPASNWFALRFGRKRFLIACVIIFTIASFFCGAAPTLTFILIARVVQGAGGGALQPLSQAILMESFPPKKRAAAMALFAFGVVVAPVIGPTLGGWLTDTYSWRYAFYINIPVGILAVIAISRFVHDPHYVRKANPGRFDGIGFGLLALWTGTLQVMLDKGQEADWFGAIWLRWFFVIFTIAFILFIIHSWRKDKPLVNLRTFKDWNFAVGSTLIFAFGICIYSMITVLPLYFQELLGYTAFAAGVVVFPRGIGSIMGMPVIGYLGSKVDARYLLTFGFVVFGITSLIFGSSSLETGPTTLLWPIIITGFALSFVFVPIATETYGTLRNEQIGNASGIFNLMRNVGGSIGISLTQTELVRRSDFHQTSITNYVPRGQIWLQHRLHVLSGYLAQHTDSANAAAAAQRQIYGQLEQQSLLWAFIDVFRWTALLSFACLMLVWLFKKVHRRAPAGVH